MAMRRTTRPTGAHDNVRVTMSLDSVTAALSGAWSTRSSSCVSVVTGPVSGRAALPRGTTAKSVVAIAQFAHQVGRTDEAGVRAEGCLGEDGYGAEAGARQTTRQGFAGRLQEEVSGLGQPAADDHQFRVECGAESCDTDSQPCTDLTQHLDTGRIAGLSGPSDRGSVQATGPLVDQLAQQGCLRGTSGQAFPGLQQQGVPTAVLLPATPVAALACPAVRHHLHVAELTSHAVAAPHHLSVEYQCPADPGSEGQTEHVPVGPSSPEPEFRPGGRVRVVVDPDRHGQSMLESGLQRLATPGQVGCEGDAPFDV